MSNQDNDQNGEDKPKVRDERVVDDDRHNTSGTFGSSPRVPARDHRKVRGEEDE